MFINNLFLSFIQLVGMLLVSSSGLVEEDGIIMVFTCPLISWFTISSLFRENNNVVVLLFAFNIFVLLTKLWFMYLWELFAILTEIHCPNLHPFIMPTRNALFGSLTPSFHFSWLVLCLVSRKKWICSILQCGCSYI